MAARSLTVERKMDNDSSFVQMFIDVDDRNTLLTQNDTREIEQFVVSQIYANRGKEPPPQLRGYVFSDIEGALIIKSHVDSVGWLEQMIKSYKKKALRIRDLKDAPQYTTEVKAVFTPLNNILELLEAYDFGLQTSVWKLLRRECYDVHGGQNNAWDVRLLTDDAGRETLKRNNFKLFQGMTPITFCVISNVKRCETTGKIVRVKFSQPSMFVP